MITSLMFMIFLVSARVNVAHVSFVCSSNGRDGSC